MPKLLLLFTVCFFIAACGEAAEDPIPFSENQNQNQGDADADGEDPVEFGPRDHMGPIGGDRPVEAVFPNDYDVEGSYPLLIKLHGYGSNAIQTDAFFYTLDEAKERGVITLTPEGTVDVNGNQYWNLFPTGIDDLGYITGLIEEAVEKYAVDPDQIFLMGLSNGGFMSHLMACERGDLVRAIISFNGSSYLNESDCKAQDPVEIIHVHATDDQVVPYNGNNSMPGARVVAERWADWNQCDPEPVDGPDINVTGEVSGDETSTEIWQNCTEGGGVQLWTINGASHVPLPLNDFVELVFDEIL